MRTSLIRRESGAEFLMAMVDGRACSVAIVVPVYNSEHTLRELVQRLCALWDGAGPDEIVLVDDASADGSWAEIQALAGEVPRISGLRLSRNFGQHNALLAGIRVVTSELIVTLDDDLQNPPEEIPHLLEALTPDFDVVYGKAVVDQHGLWRNLASRTTKLALQRTMSVAVASDVSAYRAFRTDLRRAFEAYSGPFVSIDVLLTWGTTRFTSVPVRHEARRVGTSQYTLRKLFTHAMNMMTGYTTWPLRLASLVGFAFAAFGLAVLAYVLGRLIIAGHSVPGFPFLASIVAIFSGAQLFALGIIGEYLARVHFRLMERPSFVVGEMVGTGAASARPPAIPA